MSGEASRLHACANTERPASTPHAGGERLGARRHLTRQKRPRIDRITSVTQLSLELLPGKKIRSPSGGGPALRPAERGEPVDEEPRSDEDEMRAGGVFENLLRAARWTAGGDDRILPTDRKTPSEDLLTLTYVKDQLTRANRRAAKTAAQRARRTWKRVPVLPGAHREGPAARRPMRLHLCNAIGEVAQKGLRATWRKVTKSPT